MGVVRRQLIRKAVATTASINPCRPADELCFLHAAIKCSQQDGCDCAGHDDSSK